MPNRAFRFSLATAEGIPDAIILPEGLHVQMGTVTYRLQVAVQMQVLTGRCAICNLNVATINGQTCETCLSTLLRVRNEARSVVSVPQSEIIDAEIETVREEVVRARRLLQQERERMVHSIGDSISNAGPEAEAMGGMLKTPKPKKFKSRSRKRLMAEDPFKRK